MGSYLRQLTLSLGSELTQLSISQTGSFTSRVSIITYASQPKVVGNLNSYQSANEAASALLGLSVLSGDSNADLASALQLAVNLTKPQSTLQRIPVIVVFAASNSGATNNLFYITQDFQQSFGSVITVNYSPSNSNLGHALNSTASQPEFQFNNDGNLYKNLIWAFSQVNCKCPWYEVQLIRYDNSTNRNIRYAECYRWKQTTLSSSQACSPGYPADFRTKDKETFITKNLNLKNLWVVLKETPANLWISLHKGSTNNWVWYDINGSEIPLGSYTNWYNNSLTGSCAKTAQTNQWDWSTYQWVTGDCNNSDGQTNGAVCATQACDAEHFCVLDGAAPTN
uniref:VWFA domain-containing protein n=1 Tax=Acrobeloides nanus TaxID=290746 RepID=A0A914DKA1_9BILA